MKSKILSIGAVVSLALLTSLWAADILGNWIAKIPSNQWMVEIVFSFRADGTKLTGTVTDPQGETAISEGKINGDEISFVVIRISDGKVVKLLYKGKVAENEIKLTWEAQGVRMEPQKLTAKREFLRDNDYMHRQIMVPVEPQHK